MPASSSSSAGARSGSAAALPPGRKAPLVLSETSTRVMLLNQQVQRSHDRTVQALTRDCFRQKSQISAEMLSTRLDLELRVRRVSTPLSQLSLPEVRIADTEAPNLYKSDLKVAKPKPHPKDIIIRDPNSTVPPEYYIGRRLTGLTYSELNKTADDPGTDRSSHGSTAADDNQSGNKDNVLLKDDIDEALESKMRYRKRVPRSPSVGPSSPTGRRRFHSKFTRSQSAYFRTSGTRTFSAHAPQSQLNNTALTRVTERPKLKKSVSFVL